MKALNNDSGENQLNEPATHYKGFVHKSEDEKLLEDVFRSDLGKLQLFTKMLYRDATLKTAKILRNNNQ